MKQTGFQIEHCRWNCPKAAREWKDLLDVLSNNISELNILETLENRFRPLLHHHFLKIGLAGCPNGCSHPDIKDFSITGYATPRITDVLCLKCNACVSSCLEEAISLEPNGIAIDKARCLSCGNCQSVCPSGALTKGESGWNLRIGGRMGRHPRFATFEKKVSTDKEVVEWICDTILDYMKNSKPGERLTHFLERRASSV